MTLYIILTINSITMGGLLFLLSAGFSLIFGLMRIPNLTHGALFMLGAYFGVTFLRMGVNFWVAVIFAGIVLAIIGGAIERLLLRRLAGQELAQVPQPIQVSSLITTAPVSSERWMAPVGQPIMHTGSAQCIHALATIQ